MAIILKSVMARCSIWGFWPWEMEARDMVTKKVRVLRCQPAWELQNKTCSQKEASHRSPKAPKKCFFFSRNPKPTFTAFSVIQLAVESWNGTLCSTRNMWTCMIVRKVDWAEISPPKLLFLFTIYADLVRFCTRLGLINICFVSDDENIGLFRALPPQPLLLLCSSPEPKCNE